MRRNSGRSRGFSLFKLTGGRTLASVVAAAGAVALPALAAPTAASADTVLIGSGSSAAQPYMLALFTAYHRLHRNISFRYNPDGGNAGVADVQSGTSEFAIQTAPPLASQTHVTFTKFFLDGLCIDVNSSNRLRELSLGQLAGIFKQPPAYTSWSQLGGGLGGDSILTEGRDSSAGQFTFFQGAVLKGAAENSSTTQLTSDGLMKIAIEKNRDAIGYVGLANAGVKGEPPASGERALAINGVACSPANVKKHRYPLWRYDYSVVPASNPNRAVLAFLSWARTSSAAGAALSSAGAVPAFNR